MHSERKKKGHGTDLGGTDLRSRMEKREERLRSARKAAATTKGAAPAEDKREFLGSKVAYVGTDGAPTIYAEKPGGRAGGRGKRV